LFTLGSSSFVDAPWQEYAEAANYTDLPLWFLGLLGFLAIAIPFFFLFILGLKLLVNNLRPLGNIVKYTLLALWLIAVGVVIALGVKQATEFAHDGKVVQKQALALNPTDTLSIKFRYNDYYAKDLNWHGEYTFTQDEKNNEVIYSTNVRLHILKTDEKSAYIQFEKKAEGRSMVEARARAEKIAYGFKVEGSKIILDNYLVTDKTSRFRNQKVDIFLYLPEGTLLKPDSSVRDYDESDDGFFNLHYSGDYLYKVEGPQVKCLNCPANENEFGDVVNGENQSDTTTITIGHPEPPQPPAHPDMKDGETKNIKSLQINKDGIIIKTE
jgi:hypothetical protein